MKLVEGQLIHRRYRLDRRLAQGGMGEVWKGYDIQLGRPVAIKALRDDQPNMESKLQRLRAEAHNSANLAHPNIAALFEYYEHDNIGFLIMEYVPSESLADIYRKRRTLPATELLPILIQVARGLFVAHSHGVIHRDVKPANIMVSTTGEVKITDFGVSYSTNQEQITQDGMVVGTAQYISPEQAQGKQATPQSDIYSLGVVAYEGLCGHRPFTGTTPVDIAAAHVNDPVPPLPDDIDLQLRQFVMSMLEKDPRDRPKDALTVSRTLAKIERRLLDQETAQMDETMMGINPNHRMPRRVASTPHPATLLSSGRRARHRAGATGTAAAAAVPTPATTPATAAAAAAATSTAARDFGTTAAGTAAGFGATDVAATGAGTGILGDGLGDGLGSNVGVGNVGLGNSVGNGDLSSVTLGNVDLDSIIRNGVADNGTATAQAAAQSIAAQTIAAQAAAQPIAAQTIAQPAADSPDLNMNLNVNMNLKSREEQL